MRFGGFSDARQVALTLIAQQLKDDDLRELRETFIQLDKNRDGTLSCLAPLNLALIGRFWASKLQKTLSRHHYLGRHCSKDGPEMIKVSRRSKAA